VLLMQLPVAFGDRIRLEQAVNAARAGPLRRHSSQPVAVNAAIDYHVRDVHALRPILAGEALRH
jgi:hypothetical protein